MNTKKYSVIRAVLATFALAFSMATSADAQAELQLPNIKGSFRFGVLGDTGTGGREQAQVGAKLNEFRAMLPFETVVMLGDNMYGGESPRDFVKKFEKPYANLLAGGVKFYASLGNHDSSSQRFYEKFNMKGEKYYTFRPVNGIRFFALDSTYMDKRQVEWLENELSASGSEWKIAFFHHPLYSSGRTHGPSKELRNILEPVFLKHNVSLVLAGHEHFYERVNPQKGIFYFTLGSSAKLRKGDLRKTDLTAKGFDTDNVFMVCEIDKDQLYFQTVTRLGKTIDSGVIQRPQEKAAAASTR